MLSWPTSYPRSFMVFVFRRGSPPTPNFKTKNIKRGRCLQPLRRGRSPTNPHSASEHASAKDPIHCPTQPPGTHTQSPLASSTSASEAPDSFNSQETSFSGHRLSKQEGYHEPAGVPLALNESSSKSLRSPRLAGCRSSFVSPHSKGTPG